MYQFTKQILTATLMVDCHVNIRRAGFTCHKSFTRMNFTRQRNRLNFVVVNFSSFSSKHTARTHGDRQDRLRASETNTRAVVTKLFGQTHRAMRRKRRKMIRCGGVAKVKLQERCINEENGQMANARWTSNGN